MLQVYGIPNCNTVKKALDWLKQNNHSFVFHDFKKEGVTKAQLENWGKQLGWENLLNKRGTTWRGFSAEQQETAATKSGAFALMMEKPSVIKRPILVKDNIALTLGFDETVFQEKIKG